MLRARLDIIRCAHTYTRKTPIKPKVERDLLVYRVFKVRREKNKKKLCVCGGEPKQSKPGSDMSSTEYFLSVKCHQHLVWMMDFQCCHSYT
jgi:hypothetical protein